MMKKKGDLILAEKPFAHVLSMKLRGAHCDSCFESYRMGDLHKCSGCGVLWYCNRKCQKSDWSMHKLECACFVAVTPDIPIDSVRLMLRILIRIKNSETNSSFRSEPGWRQFSDLKSHHDEIKRDIERVEQFFKILFTIKKLVADAWTLPTDDQLLDIFGKMVINTFTITDKELTPLGAGLYLSASTFDHSCQPNTVVTFTGCRLEARASCDIENAAPNMYRISYIDLLTPASQRRTELQKLYYFTCSCSRCSSQQPDNLMLSSICPKAGCNGPVSQGSDGVLLCCQDCGCSEFTTEYTDMVREMNNMMETRVNKLEALREKTDYEELLTSCKSCLQRHQDIAHSSNVHIVKCHDLAFDAAINMEMWDTAIPYGLLTIEKFIMYYGESHPRVSLQLLKVGKLEHYKHRLLPAHQHLKQAIRILLLSHGTSHDLSQETLLMIMACEGELNHTAPESFCSAFA